MNALPLWVNLLMVGLYALVFTGTWLLVRDLNRLQAAATNPKFGDDIRRTLLEIRVRRATALLTALVFIGLYFFNIPLSTAVVVILGFYWLYMMWQTGLARDYITEAERAASIVAQLEDSAQRLPPAPRVPASGWSALLLEKAKASPRLRQQLAQVMWLDAYLVRAAARAPDRECPEMRLEWQLCIEIACELGIPEQEGADWVSHNATSIGRQLHIRPSRPRTV